MVIGGIQKTTLIDYPGKVACTVFLVGCNFRCPFCHNKDLVTSKLFKKAALKPIKEKDFFTFLEKRKKLLDGACITGGEPCINKDLPKFLKKIKNLGLKVKLDTNGSNPQMLKNLMKKDLIDFIAMDVKTAFEDYSKATNVKIQISKVKNSIDLVIKSGLPYEFRTTVVPGIHNKKVMLGLAKQLKRKTGKVNWILQQFRSKNCLDSKFLKVRPYTNQAMKDILKSVQKILPQTKLRGIEE